MSQKSLATYIGWRYASAQSGGQMSSLVSRLSIAGLAMGVAILITVLSLMNGFDRELRHKILAMMPHITVNSLQGYDLQNREEWQRVITSLQQSIPEITGIAPQLTLQGMLLGSSGSVSGVIVSGIQPDLEKQVSIIDQFTTGASLDDLAAGSDNIIIGSTLAEELGITIGDSVILVSTERNTSPLGVSFRKAQYNVAGTFTIGSELDQSLVYVNMEDIQPLYNLRNDEIHGLRIQINDLFRVNSVGEQVYSLVPDSTRLSYWTREYGPVYDNIHLSKTLVGLLLLLLVVVAIFNVVVSLLMIVRDKHGDIAILRAMGCPEKQIRRIFLVQGSVIALLGAGSGLVLGVLGAVFIPDLFDILQTALGTDLLSADVYPVNYLPSQLSFTDCFGVVLVSFLLCTTASVLPARAAARIKPAVVLREE